jgi:hypothetical protein
VKQAVDQHFARLPGYRPGDIITKGDVQPLFGRLNELGWPVKDQQAILAQLLGKEDFLVATLRTNAGRRFMGKVSRYDLMYDRLDRIARESGGRELLTSLVRLPDGQRYASPRRPRAVPGLVDMLPKNASGKTRKVADYNKPTGRIYTADQLLQRLQQSYDRANSR